MGTDLTSIISTLERLDIRIRADGDNLLANPKGAIPDDLRVLLREHKAELIARLECDAEIVSMLEEVNFRCPPDWRPTPDEWIRLDEIQWKLDQARDGLDVPAVRLLCAEYETEAGRMFEQRKGKATR